MSGIFDLRTIATFAVQFTVPSSRENIMGYLGYPVGGALVAAMGAALTLAELFPDNTTSISRLCIGLAVGAVALVLTVKVKRARE
ncbi:MAG: hypothetical protein WD851_01090 [Pirellulales bacterium]